MNNNNKGHSALRKGRTSLPNHVYHVTTTTFKRQPLFRDFLLARAACQRFVQSSLLKDTQLLAWVLMPDHVHWLITLGNQSNLSQLITNLKSSSARAVNQCRQNGGAVWASAFYDHVLRNDEDIKTVARYIIANPLRAGLAEHMGDYSFWNCVWMPE